MDTRTAKLPGPKTSAAKLAQDMAIRTRKTAAERIALLQLDVDLARHMAKGAPLTDEGEAWIARIEAEQTKIADTAEQIAKAIEAIAKGNTQAEQIAALAAELAHANARIEDMIEERRQWRMRQAGA